MNGINRGGQKVVCVMEMEVTDVDGRTYGGPVPVVDQTYTVDAFVDSRMIFADDRLASVDTFPGITVLELPPLRGKCGRIFGWPIMAFRPKVDEARFASISEMIDAAKRATVPRTKETV